MYKNIQRLIFILFLLMIGLFSCKNQPTPKKVEDHDNVAKGLEKSGTFERDTVRKDGMKIEKKNLKK